MAFQVLGQVNPAATTDTTLYTASGAFVVTSLFICNQGTAPIQVRVAVRPNGASLAAQHYIVYDAWIEGNWFAVLTTGITGDASDVITVRSTTSTTSFSAFGDA